MIYISAPTKNIAVMSKMPRNLIIAKTKALIDKN
jgi:hypothetical protein